MDTKPTFASVMAARFGRDQLLALAAMLREAFTAWYGNGHVNETDRDTIILRITLTDGVVLRHGERFVYPA